MAPSLAPFVPRRLRLVALIGAAVVLLAFVALTSALGTIGWSEWTPWDAVWMNGIGLALAGLGLRMGLIVARPTPEGLRIRNLFRGRTLAWGQIVGASYNEADGDAWAALDLSDGTTVPVMAIQGSDGPRVHGEVQRLRSLIDFYS